MRASAATARAFPAAIATGAGFLALLNSSAGRAVDAADYLLVPTVVKGERELDWHSGSGSAGPALSPETDTALGVGAGLTDHWFSEVTVRYQHLGGRGLDYHSTEWENVFSLAEPGQWAVDTALFASVEQKHEIEDRTLVTLGSLLQRDFGLVQANFNVLLGKQVAGAQSTGMSLHSQAQLKYRYSEPLEFGVQSFDRWSSDQQSMTGIEQQSHRLGPVVLGQFKLAHERAISYNVAYLVGSTRKSPDRTLRAQFEYEF